MSTTSLPTYAELKVKFEERCFELLEPKQMFVVLKPEDKYNFDAHFRSRGYDFVSFHKTAKTAFEAFVWQAEHTTTKEVKCLDELDNKVSFVKRWACDPTRRIVRYLCYIPSYKNVDEMKEYRFQRKSESYAESFNLFLGYNSEVTSTSLLPKVNEQVDEAAVQEYISRWIEVVRHLCNYDESAYRNYVQFLKQRLLHPEVNQQVGYAFYNRDVYDHWVHLIPIEQAVINVENIGHYKHVFYEHAWMMPPFWVYQNFGNLRAVEYFMNCLKTGQTKWYRKMTHPVLVFDTKITPIVFMDSLLAMTQEQSQHFRIVTSSLDKRIHEVASEWQVKEQFKEPLYAACVFYYLTRMV